MTTRALLSILLLSSAACAGSDRAIDPAVVIHPVPSRSSAPLPSSSTIAVEPPPPVDAPLPIAPPGVDADLVRFAGSICATEVLPIDTNDLARGYRVGCRSHPPFDKPEQKNDGKIVTQGDPIDICSIDKVYRGSFTRPGAKQAALAMSACRFPDGEWDAGFPGSVIIVEESGDRWKVATYGPNVTADQNCLMTKLGDGRDGIVCQTSFGAFADASVIHFTSLNFGLEPDKMADTFLTIFSNDFPTQCDPSFLPPPWFGNGVTHAEIKDFAMKDMNHDGRPDIIATVERSRVAPSAALDAKVTKLCKGRESLDASAYLPKPRVFKLELDAVGDSFVPNAATERLLDAWGNDPPNSL